MTTPGDRKRQVALILCTFALAFEGVRLAQSRGHATLVFVLPAVVLATVYLVQEVRVRRRDRAASDDPASKSVPPA